jgi:hypothetical protein
MKTRLGLAVFLVAIVVSVRARSLDDLGHEEGGGLDGIKVGNRFIPFD